ncbi:hypothetical protein ACFCXC_18475 [Streptomyces microflavus]|uniref:Uncharacterized protein n=2 Tax=Streptomyces microflavus TaxID=1919 RepID=N0D0A0_STRMI|nr:hypothetical protein [Streptomyces microflavus]AGK78657.1 hypothetical protein SFUL_3739 [Streptomyces microflavus DSM 40593]
MNKLVALELLGAAGLILLLRQGWGLRRQIESMRAEIAAARIASALDTDGSVP